MLKKNTKGSSYVFALFSAFVLFPSISAETKKLFIYQTSDIHSKLLGENSGWLNMAQTMKFHRKELGIKEENSLLIDCGDTISGSIIGSLSKGQAALELLSILKYDSWVIGNHDLEFGLKTIRKISENSNLDILAANLKAKDGKGFIGWKLYDKDGVKAAVIGLTSPHIDAWFWCKKRLGYTISPTIETIVGLMPEILKTEPDIIILAIHHGRFSPKRLNGLNIARIAERFPEIDLIMGGHSHQEIPGEKCGISSWYVETGCHAKKFGFIEVTVNTQKNRVEEIESRLIPAKKVHKFDPELKKFIDKWVNKAEKFSKQEVGMTKNEIAPNGKKELFGSMNELFCRAISSTANSEMAFHGSVIESAKFSEIITEQDVFNAIPYEDSVCTLELNPSELNIIIREQIFNKNRVRFQSPFGIIISVDRDNEISLTDQKGKRLKKGKRYKCAFSSYTLAGAGGRFPELKRIAMLKTSKGKDTGQTIRDALRKYIKANSPLNIEIIKRIHYGN